MIKPIGTVSFVHLSLFLSLSAAGQKQVLEDNWKSFQLINASLICTRSPHRCPMVTPSASLQNPLFQIALFISPPAVSFSTGPSCILLGCLVKRKEGGEKKQQKGNEEIKRKKWSTLSVMATILHFIKSTPGGYCERITVLLFSFLLYFSFSLWLNQENEISLT